MKGNQTSYQFAYVPQAIEKYLALISIENDSNKNEIIDADRIDERDKFVDKNWKKRPEENNIKVDE